MRAKGLAPKAILVAWGVLLSCTGPSVEGEGRPVTGPSTAATARESIHDRVVHLEPALLTEIPPVARWCDRLDSLEVHRLDVGAGLYVETEGGAIPGAIPIVLINGGPGGTHHYFHPWFSRAAEFARVVYYDQRGTGLSERAPGPDGYSVEQAVEDLDGIRRALGIEKWIVLGYSYGGFLAQYYTTIHPDAVAGLALVGASPGMWIDTGPSRQGSFLTQEERDHMRAMRVRLDSLREAEDLSRTEFIQLLLYNNFSNGDWKRQHYYRPSPERLAQIALYEWDHDENFNGIMNGSAGRVDLTGAFEGNPIPTLILEGDWDLTWGEQKPDILRGNHPNARFERFRDAGHGIYDEDPEAFFETLRAFVESLPEVTPSALAEYQRQLASWDEARKAAPAYAIRSQNWGRAGSTVIAARYAPGWLDQLDAARDFMRLGFALYDEERYEDALHVFERMHAFVLTRGASEGYVAFALLWQGHALDLLGRRDAARDRYARVVEMGIDDGWQHSQYGLTYDFTPYARERLDSPFERLENRDPD
jgi:proline iminopeptidase